MGATAGWDVAIGVGVQVSPTAGWWDAVSLESARACVPGIGARMSPAAG
jgi:hypothetical protein